MNGCLLAKCLKLVYPYSKASDLKLETFFRVKLLRSCDCSVRYPASGTRRPVPGVRYPAYSHGAAHQ